jgi:hypothetical protein
LILLCTPSSKSFRAASLVSMATIFSSAPAIPLYSSLLGYKDCEASRSRSART